MLDLGAGSAPALDGTSDEQQRERDEGERRAAFTATPGRCRSSRASCGPRRGSGRATCRARPRASGSGSDSAGPTVCVSRGTSPGVSQRWPWTWKVWKSEPIAITSHCTSSPTFAWKTGVLPTKARPSIVMNFPIGARTTSNSRSGACSFRPRIESIPYMPPRDRVHHRRRVVVVGPDAGRVLAGGAACRCRSGPA